MLSYLSIHIANLFISWIVHFICIFYSPPLMTPYLKPAYTIHMKYDNQTSRPISSSPTFVFHVLGILSIHYRMKDYILSKVNVPFHGARLFHPQSRSSRLRSFVDSIFLFPFYSWGLLFPLADLALISSSDLDIHSIIQSGHSVLFYVNVILKV